MLLYPLISCTVVLSVMVVCISLYLICKQFSFFEFVLSTLTMLKSVGRPIVWPIVYTFLHGKVHNLGYTCCHRNCDYATH